MSTGHTDGRSGETRSLRSGGLTLAGDPVPYFSDGQSVIFHGDALDLLPRLSLSVDLVFTSPRYNLGTNPGGQFGHWKDGQNSGGNTKWKGTAGGGGIDYDDGHDDDPPAVYQAWQQMALALLWESLSDTGAIFYNHRPRVQRDGLWSPLSLNPGLPVRQVIVWDRGSGLNYTPTGYVPMHEWIIVLAKQGWRLKSKAASGAGDVWRIPFETGNPHPAPFPVELPARAIDTTGAASVLDPFMGSGSTLVAASDAGVPSIGIDKSERYCEMAAKRLTERAEVVA